MSEYYWDNQNEYLSNTRGLYYNDDYLEFLVQKVWKIDKPVNMIDFGCGFGYLGIKLLPLLPKGSSYTGVDKGEKLIQKAIELFSHAPYQTEFVVADMELDRLEGRYDIVLCHAFLLHMTEPAVIIQKMIDCVEDNGRIICFEPHWIANMANYVLDGLEHSKVIQLGVLQKLFEEDAKKSGKDGNIGLKIPIILIQLGVESIDCRVSDKVNFLDQNMDGSSKEKLYLALKDEGLGQEPAQREIFIRLLLDRGMTEEEANKQYEAEQLFAEQFGDSSWLAYAPNMKITSGIVKRE